MTMAASTSTIDDRVGFLKDYAQHTRPVILDLYEPRFSDSTKLEVFQYDEPGATGHDEPGGSAPPGVMGSRCIFTVSKQPHWRSYRINGTDASRYTLYRVERKALSLSKTYSVMTPRGRVLFSVKNETGQAYGHFKVKFRNILAGHNEQRQLHLRQGKSSQTSSIRQICEGDKVLAAMRFPSGLCECTYPSIKPFTLIVSPFVDISMMLTIFLCYYDLLNRHKLAPSRRSSEESIQYGLDHRRIARHHDHAQDEEIVGMVESIMLRRADNPTEVAIPPSYLVATQPPE